ncbi:MAG: hypothetical protein MZW92_58080 [Comamonadaceae bacterium]|nr:hypothetical protein [Comamonadaceae bacterium]
MVRDDLDKATSAAPSAPPTAFAATPADRLMMGGNHVAARLAFDHGVDVRHRGGASAAASPRSWSARCCCWQRVPLAADAARTAARCRPSALLVGGAEPVPVLGGGAAAGGAGAAGLQHLPAVDRAVGARASTATGPNARVLLAMPVMLFGLALALDVLGAASGLGAAGAVGPHRRRRGLRARRRRRTFGLALVLTQHEAGDLDGRAAHRHHDGHRRRCWRWPAWRLQGGCHLPTRRARLVGPGGADACSTAPPSRSCSPCCRGWAWWATRRS